MLESSLRKYLAAVAPPNPPPTTTTFFDAPKTRDGIPTDDATPVVPMIFAKFLRVIFLI